MPAAANLRAAASQSYDDLVKQWTADTLRDALLAFATAVQATFPEDVANNRPVGAWLTIILAKATNMSTTVTDITASDVASSSFDVYRICWLADYFNAQGLITVGQAAALLAAYNANIA